MSCDCHYVEPVNYQDFWSVCLSRGIISMAKSLRSKRKQKVKAVRREKYRKIEGKKCWEKHLALQAEKNEDMSTEASVGGHLLKHVLNHVLAMGVNCVETVQVVSTETADIEKVVDSDISMETDTKMSRKGLLKMMKLREARRKKKKTKRLGGKRSHSKW